MFQQKQPEQEDSSRCEQQQTESEQSTSKQSLQQQPQKATTKQLTQVEREFWQQRLPRGFQFYLERLARGVIRNQPVNILEFSAVFLEELLVNRNELWKLPVEPYFAKLYHRKMGHAPWQPRRRHLQVEHNELSPYLSQTLPDIIATEFLPESSLPAEGLLYPQSLDDKDTDVYKEREETPDMFTASDCLCKMKDLDVLENSSSQDPGHNTTVASATFDVSSGDASIASFDVTEEVQTTSAGTVNKGGDASGLLCETQCPILFTENTGPSPSSSQNLDTSIEKQVEKETCKERVTENEMRLATGQDVLQPNKERIGNLLPLDEHLVLESRKLQTSCTLDRLMEARVFNVTEIGTCNSSPKKVMKYSDNVQCSINIPDTTPLILKCNTISSYQFNQIGDIENDQKTHKMCSTGHGNLTVENDASFYCYQTQSPLVSVGPLTTDSEVFPQVASGSRHLCSNQGISDSQIEIYETLTVHHETSHRTPCSETSYRKPSSETLQEIPHSQEEDNTFNSFRTFSENFWGSINVIDSNTSDGQSLDPSYNTTIMSPAKHNKSSDKRMSDSTMCRLCQEKNILKDDQTMSTNHFNPESGHVLACACHSPCHESCMLSNEVKPVVGSKMKSGTDIVSKEINSGIEIVLREINSGIEIVPREISSGTEIVSKEINSGIEIVLREINSGIEIVPREISSGIEIVPREISSGIEIVSKEINSETKIVPKEINSRTEIVSKMIKSEAYDARSHVLDCPESNISTFEHATNRIKHESTYDTAAADHNLLAKDTKFFTQKTDSKCWTESETMTGRKSAAIDQTFDADFCLKSSVSTSGGQQAKCVTLKMLSPVNVVKSDMAISGKGLMTSPDNEESRNNELTTDWELQVNTNHNINDMSVGSCGSAEARTHLLSNKSEAQLLEQTPQSESLVKRELKYSCNCLTIAHLESQHKQPCPHVAGASKLKMERALSLARNYISELEQVASEVERIVERHDKKGVNEAESGGNNENPRGEYSQASDVGEDRKAEFDTPFCVCKNVDKQEESFKCDHILEVSCSFLNQVSQKIVDIWDGRDDVSSFQEGHHDFEFRMGNVVLKIKCFQHEGEGSNPVSVRADYESVTSFCESAADKLQEQTGGIKDTNSAGKMEEILVESLQDFETSLDGQSMNNNKLIQVSNNGYDIFCSRNITFNTNSNNLYWNYNTNCNSHNLNCNNHNLSYQTSNTMDSCNLFITYRDMTTVCLEQPRKWKYGISYEKTDAVYVITATQSRNSNNNGNASSEPRTFVISAPSPTNTFTEKGDNASFQEKSPRHGPNRIIIEGNRVYTVSRKFVHQDQDNGGNMDSPQSGAHDGHTTAEYCQFGEDIKENNEEINDTHISGECSKKSEEKYPLNKTKSITDCPTKVGTCNMRPKQSGTLSGEYRRYKEKREICQLCHEEPKCRSSKGVQFEQSDKLVIQTSDTSRDISTDNNNKDISSIDNSNKDISSVDNSNKDISSVDNSNKDISSVDNSNKDISSVDNSNKDISSVDNSNKDNIKKQSAICFYHSRKEREQVKMGNIKCEGKAKKAMSKTVCHRKQCNDGKVNKTDEAVGKDDNEAVGKDMSEMRSDKLLSGKLTSHLVQIGENRLTDKVISARNYQKNEKLTSISPPVQQEKKVLHPNKNDFPLRIRAISKHKNTNWEYVSNLTRRLTVESPNENLLVHSLLVHPNPRQPEMSRHFEVTSQKKRLYLGDDFNQADTGRRLICETECFSSIDPSTQHLVIENGTSVRKYATVKMVTGNAHKRRKQTAENRQQVDESDHAKVVSDTNIMRSPLYHNYFDQVGNYIIIGKPKSMGFIHKLIQKQELQSITVGNKNLSKNRNYNQSHLAIEEYVETGTTINHTWQQKST